MSSTITSLSVRALSTRLLLPDCFYGNAKNVTILYFLNIVVQGNSSFPDPLERLALAISSSPFNFQLSSSYIVTDTGAPATIDWSAISTITSSVTGLSFTNTNLGTGSTIPTFPRPIEILQLSNTGLSGPLPTTLFASATPPIVSFMFAAQSNALNGTIPATLLSNLDFTKIALSFNFYVSSNQLTGTVPTALLSGSFTGTSMYVDVSGNSLDGPLNNVFASTIFSSTKLSSFSFIGSNNNFSGTAPAWLNQMGALTSFSFSCDNCKLSGLPAAFLTVSQVKSIIAVSLKNNLISGAIPSTFFAMGGSADTFSVVLSGNRLASMPSDMLDLANFNSATSVRIDLSSNSLKGSLPSSAGLLGNLSSLATYSINFAVNTALTSTLPSSFLASFGATASTASTAITLTLGSTAVTGELALPDLSAAPKVSLTISSSLTNFTSLTYPDGATSGLVSLDLTNNYLLQGELSTSFFQYNPNLKLLSVSSSMLSGTMPDMGSLNPTKLATLSLSTTAIDFCSGTRANWTSSTLTSCILSSTSAYYCQGAYPSQCSFSAPAPTTPPTTPTSPPTAPASPPSVPTTPPTTPPVSPSDCLNSTRPSLDWICINGTWTFTGSVNSTVITIPSGSQTTTIKGNLTSSTVVINGLGSVLVIEGCTSNTTILVELTPAQLEEIGKNGKLQQLLTLSNASSCNSSLSDITISTSIKGSSCKKVSVSKVSSSSGSLAGLFTVSSSGCNTWWIILVSVICAVVLLGLVAAIAAYLIIQKRSESRAHKSLKTQG